MDKLLKDRKRWYWVGEVTAMVVVLLAVLIVSDAQGQMDCSGIVSGTGDAFYYDYTPGTGACSFTGDDSDPLVAAMNLIDYDGSTMCGRYVRVTGPLGTVDVRIVDLYPDGLAGDIDLNRPAFEQIADLGQGHVEVTWETIASTDTGPVSVYMMDGSSVWWLAIQVRNHRYGIASLEYLGPSGYVPAPRESYNFFIVDQGMGVPVPLDDPFDVRLTDVHGQTLVITGIPISPGEEVISGDQFPECSDVSSATPPLLRNPGFELHYPVPNPFNPQTTIAFNLPKRETVTLRVFDISGRLVRELVGLKAYTPGLHEVAWNGRDHSGRQVASGTYFYRLEAGAYSETKRMVLIK